MDDSIEANMPQLLRLSAGSSDAATILGTAFRLLGLRFLARASYQIAAEHALRNVERLACREKMDANLSSLLVGQEPSRLDPQATNADAQIDDHRTIGEVEEQEEQRLAWSTADSALYNLVRAGESSGTLHQVLTWLSTRYARIGMCQHQNRAGTMNAPGPDLDSIRPTLRPWANVSVASRYRPSNLYLLSQHTEARALMPLLVSSFAAGYTSSSRRPLGRTAARTDVSIGDTDLDSNACGNGTPEALLWAGSLKLARALPLTSSAISAATFSAEIPQMPQTCQSLAAANRDDETCRAGLQTSAWDASQLLRVLLLDYALSRAPGMAAASLSGEHDHQPEQGGDDPEVVLVLQPFVPQEQSRLSDIAMAGVLSLTSSPVARIVLAPDTDSGSDLCDIISAIAYYMCYVVPAACDTRALGEIVRGARVEKRQVDHRLETSIALDPSYQGIADIVIVANADTVFLRGSSRDQTRRYKCMMQTVSAGAAVFAVHRRETPSAFKAKQHPCLHLLQAVLAKALSHPGALDGKVLDWNAVSRRAFGLLSAEIKNCAIRHDGQSILGGGLAAEAMEASSLLVPRTDSQDAWVLPGRISNIKANATRSAMSRLREGTRGNLLGQTAVDSMFTRSARQVGINIRGAGTEAISLHFHSTRAHEQQVGSGSALGWSLAEGLLPTDLDVCA